MNAHSPHVEERSYPGILACDVLGSVQVGQPSHCVKEMNILGDESWEIMDTGLTNVSRHHVPWKQAQQPHTHSICCGQQKP